MGSDPATSVVDPWCRVWGHDNVRVVDASVHVTNGGVNPVLTVFANAYRVHRPDDPLIPLTHSSARSTHPPCNACARGRRGASAGWVRSARPEPR